MDKIREGMFAGMTQRAGARVEDLIGHPAEPKRRLAGEEFMEMLEKAREMASNVAGAVEGKLSCVASDPEPVNKAEKPTGRRWPSMFDAYREQVEDIIRSLEEIKDTLRRLEF